MIEMQHDPDTGDTRVSFVVGGGLKITPRVCTFANLKWDDTKDHAVFCPQTLYNMGLLVGILEQLKDDYEEPVSSCEGCFGDCDNCCCRPPKQPDGA
jgi:hypothetical protein